MKTILVRTGSLPPHPGSPKTTFSHHHHHSTAAGVVFSSDKITGASPRESLHLPIKAIRRVSSDSDVIASEFDKYCPTSKRFSAGIPEEEPGFGGGGKISGGGGTDGDFGGGYEDKRNIDDYYREMLKLNPGDSLLLRNYGKYLHEVEKDTVRAEECYGRAILASPGDGEVLSLYAKLIWETQRDEARAESYFDQAVLASPNDCMVLGSYAQFMWEAEEVEEIITYESEIPSTMVSAF